MQALSLEKSCCCQQEKMAFCTTGLEAKPLSLWEKRVPGCEACTYKDF